MNSQVVYTMMPFAIIALATLILLLTISFYRHHRLTLLLTQLAFIAGFYAVVIQYSGTGGMVEPLFIVDRFALFFIGLVFAASFIVAVMAFSYFSGKPGQHEEFYLLLLMAALGSAVLAAGTHFIALFLGLEILSVSLYTMVAFLREREKSIEAGSKYLILAAASSAFLLMGMALLYAETGSMDLAAVRSAVVSSAATWLGLAGVSLMIIAIGFKLALVPFHLWTPDVYEGAPAPTTAFIATVSKAGMVAVLLRLFAFANMDSGPSLRLCFTVIAVASMLIGNWLALRQKNVKRILAYSSIAHFGYLLVALLVGGQSGTEAALFYILAYTITSLGAFGVISFLSGQENDTEEMEQYRGLFWHRPGISLVFSAMLFSLAGIPLTAGFIGKFLVLISGVKDSAWLLVLVLVLTSAIGIYYYLKIIAVMFSHFSAETVQGPTVSSAAKMLLMFLLLLLLWFGINPQGILGIIHSAAASIALPSPSSILQF